MRSHSWDAETLTTVTTPSATTETEIIQEAAGESADIEQSGSSDSTSVWLIDRGEDYFNDFDDYNPNGFRLDAAASIRDVDGEIALVLEGTGSAVATIHPLLIDSYELTYDLYSDDEFSSWNQHELLISMPRDSLDYRFNFREEMDFDYEMEGNYNSNARSAPHSLRPGWNNIRIVVNKEASTVSLFANNTLIISIDDLPVEDTFDDTVLVQICCKLC